MDSLPPPPLPPVYSPQNPAPRGGGLGCFAKGCVVLLIVGLITAAGLVGLGFWAVGKARSYTADHPEPVPVLEATDAQAADVAARLKAFSDALDRHERATLTLSAEDLNIVIARDPRYRDLRGRVFFTIQKDALHARASFPLDKIPGFKGRWFNGEAGLDVRFADGELSLKPVSLEYQGKQASPATLRALSTPEARQQLNESLHEQMRKNPRFEKTMRQVESIDIKDNKLVIVADGGGGADEEKEEKSKT